MIPDAIAEPLMEFASRCGEIPNLRTAVMFGSAATDTLTKKSDIDVLLMFDVRGNPETGKEAEAVHGLAGEISSKWELPYPFAFVMYGEDELVEPSLLREVLRDGIVLYARPRDVLSISKERLEPFILVSYTLKDMPPKDKMALQRGLYGYEVVRKVGNKEYRNSKPGLVGSVGRRIGSTAFLIPHEYGDEIRELFNKNKCEFKEIPIWLS